LATQCIGVGDKKAMPVSQSFESGSGETPKPLPVTPATVQRQH
jgi:hypothetical protein